MERRDSYALFERQSERGNAYASWKLSVMHALGRECERSMTRSMEFVERSVEQGSPLGKRDLALAVLRGASRAVSIERAYELLLEVMQLGMVKEPAKVLLQSGNETYEKAAADALRTASFARCAFEERMFVAMFDAMQAGIPASKGELNSYLHELMRNDDRAKAALANRVLWLADATALFLPLQDGVQVVKALLSQPDLASKVDAYELARSLPTGCPAELKAAAVGELAIAGALGHTHAKLIVLTEAVSNAKGEPPRELVQQVYDIIRENPHLINEHVIDMFKELQEKNPDSAHEHMELLVEIDSEKFVLVRSALALTAMHVGLADWTAKISHELINLGDVGHFGWWVHLQIRDFKNGRCDAETALFWAECWQQDNHSEGLAAVSEIYEAMGAQTNEQKLAHFQVLDERARQGDAEALCDLGILLLEGNSAVLGNKQRAFELLKMASDAKIPRAMHQLGLCHIRGLGTGVDEDLGNFWISQAAAHGYSRAKLQSAKQEAERENAGRDRKGSGREREGESESGSGDDDGGENAVNGEKTEADEETKKSTTTDAINAELQELKGQIVELVTYRKKQMEEPEANSEGA